MRKLSNAQSDQFKVFVPTNTVQEDKKQRKGVVVFFTGLSGSGKTTLANKLVERWVARTGLYATKLDGDDARRLLSSDLGFSKEHRNLNIQRMGFVATEIASHGGFCVISAIAPYNSSREELILRVKLSGSVAVLVHVSTPLDICESRDHKELYSKARRGEIKNFTGIDDPYEVPETCDLELDMTEMGVELACEIIEEFCKSRLQSVL